MFGSDGGGAEAATFTENGVAETGGGDGGVGGDCVVGGAGRIGVAGAETGTPLFVQVGHNESVDPVGIMYVFWQPGHCHRILPGTEDIGLFHFQQGKFLTATE